MNKAAASALDLKPSIDWKEVIAPGEDTRFAGFAKQFAELQARKSAKYGVGRALHRKQIMAVTGTLKVLPKLPQFARHGLFAKPGVHEVWARLSNGGLDRAPDRRPDIRGFSLRVFGVTGDSALGNGPVKSQDFTLINQEKFAFATSTEFVDFVIAASRGNVTLLKYMLRRYGLMRGPARVAQMMKTVKKPFGGFATDAMFSSVPMACGLYAVRVRLLPSRDNGGPTPGASEDWQADVAARLARQDLMWDLQLQPFVSEALTPIEDASVNWPTPYTTVARLVIPKQKIDSEQARAFAEKVENAVFDPWQAMAAHRPLGEVQRARKVVYFHSQKGRHAV
jgi:hypothetical protein